MNFQQLRILREAARQQFNLTEVANRLYTSQSGVSKHIKDLEAELGIELFERKGKRLLGFTQPGEKILEIAERILLDTANIKQLAQHYSHEDEGQLTLATTHTQARYVLPPIISQFKKRFPKVHLELQQCGPEEISNLLRSGKVDLGIATEALQDEPTIACFPFHSWHHGVVLPQSHPLLSVPELTLEAIAAYPIITYHPGFTGRQSIDESFARAGIKPDIVLSALDADVIKTYVELGVGIGIIASVAYQPERDRGLVLRQADHLFPAKTTQLALRRGHYLRQFVYQFIELCSHDLTPAKIQSTLTLS